MRPQLTRIGLSVAIVLCSAAAPSLSFAEDATGCAAFKWPVDHERAALLATKPVVANGGALPLGAAVALKLQPLDEAGLPQPPERAPKYNPSNAGHFTLAAPPKAGMYKITVASDAWIDVIDSDAFVKSKGFSGAKGCEGARKTVRFDLPAREVTVQISGVHDAELWTIVTPAQ